MEAIVINTFKQGLREKRRQIGGWLTTGSPTVTEIFAGIGFDWLLLDMEHSPNDFLLVVDHLRAAGVGAPIVVRVPWNEPIMVKRLLDAGVTSLMFPYVQTVEEAKAAVAATRYPPHGIRGVAGTTRATSYGRRENLARAAEQIAVVVQIETPEAMTAIGDIARVDGVDGVFIGPNDLAANMGHLGSSTHPEVRDAMLRGAAQIRAAGKSSGTLGYNSTHSASPFTDGFDFLGVASDAGAIVAGATEKLGTYSRFRDEA
ncbi:MAG TPA: aldolase/citrate lyase family protein [Devosia sp.]|nr:aldolase/citrate lyase family protein [Devosia sp.]